MWEDSRADQYTKSRPKIDSLHLLESFSQTPQMSNVFSSSFEVHKPGESSTILPGEQILFCNVVVTLMHMRTQQKWTPCGRNFDRDFEWIVFSKVRPTSIQLFFCLFIRYCTENTDFHRIGASHDSFLREKTISVGYPGYSHKTEIFQFKYRTFSIYDKQCRVFTYTNKW